MKMTFGRKFFAGLSVVLVLMAMYFITLLLHPEAITANVLIIFAMLIFLVALLYISSNVFTKFITSKFFRPELVGK